MKSQQGFSIVMALFILVVLSLLGTYMMRLSGVQHATSSYTLLGARAYQAARAGIEWSIARINNGGSCSDVNAQTALTFTDLSGFSVKLSCSSNSYSEGNKNPVVYQLKSTSAYNSYASQDYVSRQIEVSVVMNN